MNTKGVQPVTVETFKPGEIVICFIKESLTLRLPATVNIYSKFIEGHFEIFAISNNDINPVSGVLVITSESIFPNRLTNDYYTLLLFHSLRFEFTPNLTQFLLHVLDPGTLIGSLLTLRVLATYYFSTTTTILKCNRMLLYLFSLLVAL